MPHDEFYSIKVCFQTIYNRVDLINGCTLLSKRVSRHHYANPVYPSINVKCWIMLCHTTSMLYAKHSTAARRAHPRLVANLKVRHYQNGGIRGR